MSEAASRAGWQPATYYPDPAIYALDPRFEKYWLKLSAVERLTTGLRWAEGPVWFGDGRYLLCSDIPNNRIIKWEEETGAVSIYRKPSNFGNGHTRDRQGRLITCEHGGRRVTRTEYDGAVTVLMDSFEGKRLNSPNDVVVKSDGSIWFTDPVFGILGNYEGVQAEPELPGRLPRRRRRQSVVRLGHGLRRARRRHGLQPRRGPHRPHQAAGALRQRVLRRPSPQPPVHGGEPADLCAL